MIVKTDGKNSEHIDALTKLHSAVLPESAVSKLGSFFMRNFYYSTLVEKGFINAYLYDCNGKYTGFISCTAYPFDFMKKGILTSPFKLVYLLMISILASPFRLFTLLNMLYDNFPVEAKKELQNCGQFMSFGVLKEYRKHPAEDSNKTIPQLLMDQVFVHFRTGGFDSFFLLVLESNERAIKFYKKYNCEILNQKAGNSLIMKFVTNNEE